VTNNSKSKSLCFCRLQDDDNSIEIGPSGTLKLIKSYQAYEFNNSGMRRNAMTSPLATGAASMQQSYQVRSLPSLSKGF